MTIQKISLIVFKTLLILLCIIVIVLRILLWNSVYVSTNTQSQGGEENLNFSSAIQNAGKHAILMMQECKIPGMSVAVAKDGNLIWSEAFGYADKDKKVPAQTNTIFRIASISKSFTAVGMMKLVEQGKLNMQASVQKYVPEFPDKGHAITPQLLASHRSGIRNYWNDSEALNKKHYNDVIESLEKFKDDSLLFIPGTDYEYSGYGYVLLSAVMQRAAEKDFLAYMYDSVFIPLGMMSTNPELINNPLPDESRFYDNVTPYSHDGSIVLSPYINYGCKWAAGGFLSTTEDMVRMGNALLPGKNSFLNQATLDSLFKPRTMMRGILGYDYGWMTAYDPYLRKVNFNFGAGSGATSALIIYPNQEAVIAIAANLGHAKFPYNRLMNIVNSFVEKPVLIFYNMLTIVAILYLLWQIKNFCTRFKTKRNENILV